MKVLDPSSQKRAPEAFDVQQYLEDKYAYLDYPLYARSYHHPIEDLPIFHSAVQALKYDYSTLNPVNRLVSEIVAADYNVKWRGNLIMIPVVRGKVAHFIETDEELEVIDRVIQQ